MSSLHCDFFGDWVVFDGLYQLVLFLLKLVFFPLLKHFLQFFLVFFAIFFNTVTKTLAKLHPVFFYLLIFFSCKLMAFAQVTLVASALFDFTTLEFFEVGSLQISELLGYKRPWGVCAFKSLYKIASE